MCAIRKGQGIKAKEAVNIELDANNSSGTDSEPESNADEEVKKKKIDGGKKRKRKRMIHTGCKGKMVVNLINDRSKIIFCYVQKNISDATLLFLFSD
jgi:hypothetical protein